MNVNKIFSNWFYNFLFLWVFIGTLSLIMIGGVYLFTDDTLTSGIFIFTAFWVTIFSLAFSTITFLIRKYVVRYMKKNNGKPPVILNNSDWIKQGFITGSVIYVVFILCVSVITGLTLKLALLSAPFFLLGFYQVYFLRNNKSSSNK